MVEHDPLVLSYSHLRDLPRADEALHVLRKVASLVKPLMRARRWTVRELAEFFPDQPNLLGLNVNRGQKILVRLRYPGDRNQFLPIEQVADTMLHELAHIVHGPHDGVFYALWNQLRDEHMALTLKGYTGEGFLSEGRRLGGSAGGSGSRRRSSAKDEARRLARAAADRRRQAAERAGSGFHFVHRLGGATAQSPNAWGQMAAAAVARNARAPTKSRKPSQSQSHGHGHGRSQGQGLESGRGGCATAGHQYDDQTRRALEHQAARNGFRTPAEEEAANDAAIAQALWELVQEDEQRRLGSRYIAPTAERPEGNGGGRSWDDAVRIDDSDDELPLPSARASSFRAGGAGPAYGEAPAPIVWACPVCTLHNRGSFLSCSACHVERPADTIFVPVERTLGGGSGGGSGRSAKGKEAAPQGPPPRPSAKAAMSALRQSHDWRTSKRVTFTPSTSGGSVRGRRETPPPPPPPPPRLTRPPKWTCQFCGNVMDREWWSCNRCERIKEDWQ